MALANDKIRLALIGAGGMGSGDVTDALRNPQVELAAVADIYDGRLARAKEVWGKEVFTTRDYREVLSRNDIDAVIVGTPDHWHSRISIDAMEAGKDVYCEKPMVQKVSQGKAVIDAQKKTGRIMQVGSQYASALSFHKIKELLASGAIGELNMVEAWLDRNTAIGAWQYSIPPDATPETIDWDRFLGDARKHAFDPVRLFRWRNYQDYGTAVAGDLFVHLLTGLHTATGALGPKRVYSTGGLRYWRDGRDVPDTMLGIIEYPKSSTHPEFTFMLRVNFKSSKPQEDFGFRFIGSGGSLMTDVRTVTVSRVPRESEPGFTIDTFPKKIQEEFLAEYHKKYPQQRATADGMRPIKEEKFASPPGFEPHQEHMRIFLENVRNRKQPYEDPTFGFRAAGPALLCNTSYFENRICYWDAETMTAS
jgi:predicted dehydrogenase